MKERGQVTLFVIIIVAVLFASVGMYFIVKNSGIASAGNPQELRELELQIEDCLKEQGITAIWLVGVQGGHVNLPTDTAKTPFGETAFLLKGGENRLPKKEYIEDQLRIHINTVLPYCFDSRAYSHNLEVEEVTSEAKIYSDYVRFIAKMPISATKNDSAVRINKEYTVDIPIKLGEVLTVAETIIERQKEEEGFVPLTFLAQFEKQIIFDYIDESNVFYIIHDEESKVNNQSYNFLFAAEISNEE